MKLIEFGDFQDCDTSTNDQPALDEREEKLYSETNSNFDQTFAYLCALKEGPSYREAGRYLAQMVPSTLEPRDEDDILDMKIEELHRFLDNEDWQSVHHWFEREFPVMMQCLPENRARAFYRGIKDVYSDEAFEWFNYDG